jgi:hypothetical protein
MNLRFWKPAVPHDLERLKARVGALAADDPLWPMLLGLVRRNVETEMEALARPGIGDEEAHRARGRVGMMLDFEGQMRGVWEETHPPSSDSGAASRG